MLLKKIIVSLAILALLLSGTTLALARGGKNPTILPPTTRPPQPPQGLTADETFDIELWQDGVIHYRFDTGTNDGEKYTDPFSDTDKGHVRSQMDIWEDEMAFLDPAGREQQYIKFLECGNNCQDSYVFIRYNKKSVVDNHDTEDNNMCSYFVGADERVGRNPHGRTEYHIKQGDDGDPDDGDVKDGNTNQDGNTLRHELGHCLGLWHEFNRDDADRWLVEDPDEDGEDFSECPRDRHGTFAFCFKGVGKMPLLGNYDYDSLMHYSFDGVTDQKGNSFGRFNLDKDPHPVYISKRDKSRLLQYYTRKLHPDWGFFKSLSTLPVTVNPDDLPWPYLTGLTQATRVWAVGSPAIVFQSSGDFDIFVRGADNNLYWKSIRNNFADLWRSLGCCFGSDPSAVSPRDGEIDLIAVGAYTGKLIHKHYENGVWGSASYLNDGYPSGGIKHEYGEYIGPAIASRGTRSLDAFVVRSDGLLAVTTLQNGSWTAWSTLGQGYNVTARPAAVALSITRVQLAVNERGMYLYEGFLTFAPDVPKFGLFRTAVMAYNTPPALTKRDDANNPYRVLITNANGRISHRFANGSWIDIGGIPMLHTGPSAVATGKFSALIVINGEDATGCTVGCDPHATQPNQFIRPGGLWLRIFR